MQSKISTLQAIELLIERIATHALQEQAEQEPCSSVQAKPALQAEAPAVSAIPSRDAGEVNTQVTLPEQHPRASLGSDEDSAEPKRQSSMTAANFTAVESPPAGAHGCQSSKGQT